jgi:hypothetical protein
MHTGMSGYTMCWPVTTEDECACGCIMLPDDMLLTRRARCSALHVLLWLASHAPYGLGAVQQSQLCTGSIDLRWPGTYAGV